MSHILKILVLHGLKMAALAYCIERYYLGIRKLMNQMFLFQKIKYPRPLKAVHILAFRGFAAQRRPASPKHKTLPKHAELHPPPHSYS